MSKDKVALKSEYVIYYCHFHRTLLDSDIFDSKGNKKETNKCNSRIFYFKYKKNILWIRIILIIVKIEKYLFMKI